MKKTTTWILLITAVIFIIWISQKIGEISRHIIKEHDKSGGAWVKEVYLGPFESPSDLPDPEDLPDESKDLYDRVARDGVKGFMTYESLMENGTGEEKILFLEEMNSRQAAAKSKSLQVSAIWIWQRWKNQDWYKEGAFRQSVGATNPVVWAIWKLYANSLYAIDPKLHK